MSNFLRPSKGDSNSAVDSVSSKTSIINVAEARKQLLTLHNKTRSDLDLKPLNEDSSCTLHAQSWADKLAENDKGLSHSKDRVNMGENVLNRSASGGIALSHEIIIKSYNQWLDERDNYKYDQYPDGATKAGAVIGHYTQIIWGDTDRAGFGIAFNKNKTTLYIVGNYRQAGNIVGQYPY